MGGERGEGEGMGGELMCGGRVREGRRGWEGEADVAGGQIDWWMDGRMYGGGPVGGRTGMDVCIALSKSSEIARSQDMGLWTDAWTAVWTDGCSVVLSVKSDHWHQCPVSREVCAGPSALLIASTWPPPRSPPPPYCHMLFDFAPILFVEIPCRRL